MKSNVIDIDGEITIRTGSAVFFHTGNKSEAVWLPRSQIEINETGVAGIVTITLPEWLALDKGLI
jgi:hypothetical protein